MAKRMIMGRSMLVLGFAIFGLIGSPVDADAISCTEAITKLLPCQNFLLGGSGGITAPCCQAATSWPRRLLLLRTTAYLCAGVSLESPLPWGLIMTTLRNFPISATSTLLYLLIRVLIATSKLSLSLSPLCVPTLIANVQLW